VSTHAPPAKKPPGLRSYTVSNGSIGAADGKATSYLVAELDFDSVADILSALGSLGGALRVGGVRVPAEPTSAGEVSLFRCLFGRDALRMAVDLLGDFPSVAHSTR